MSRLDRLKEQGGEFPLMLADVYPDWLDRDDVQWMTPEPDSADVRVPSPCHRPDGELRIYFDGAEVTVCFSHWHRHFVVVPGSGSAAVEMVWLCRWLDTFLDDRTVIVNLFAADQWVGSATFGVGYGCVLSSRTRDAIGHFIFEHQNATRYEIRSWSGGLDEVHTLTPGGWEKEGGRG